MEKDRNGLTAIQTAEAITESFTYRDWPRLLTFCQWSWRRATKKPQDNLSCRFGSVIGVKHINKILIDGAPGLNPKVAVDVSIWFQSNVGEGFRFFRMIKEDKNGVPSVNGSWGFNPISYRTMPKKAKAVKVSIFKRLLKKMGVR